MRRRQPQSPQSGASSGPSVDIQGTPVVDPTENVIALTEAANKRQDDLRQASLRLAETLVNHQKEISDIRAVHQAEMAELRDKYAEKVAKAEAGRIDSIRQVDREEVAKTAVSANTAIMTLAKQTTDLATTLQKQVADTAVAAEARNSATYTEVNKRLSALELSSSEGKGKQTVSDPQIERLSRLVEAMASSQSSDTGKSQGISAVWVAIGGVAGFVLTMLSIGIALFALFNK